MKRSRQEQLDLLSTNNKRFTTGGNVKTVVKTNEDEAPSTVSGSGRERFREKVAIGGAILHESPTDLKFTFEAPKDPLEAESFYNIRLAEYNSSTFKMEAAICKFAIVKAIMGDSRESRENRLKNIDKCLQLLFEAESVLNVDKFPVTNAVINTMRAHLYRERALNATSRDYVPNRGVAAAQLGVGLKAAENALGPISAQYPGYNDNSRMVEQALLRLETGWLLILQINDATDKSVGDLSYDYAIGHLERALSLFEKWMMLFESNSAFLTSATEESMEHWVPNDPSSHPPHIKALLRGRPLKAAHGSCLALLGCAYMNWREDSEASAIAFEYLSKCVKPSFLTKENTQWVVAHHHLSKLILRDPSLVNKKNGVSQQINGIFHIDSAINHLNMALTSPVCQKWFYELNFQIGLTNLIRLYLVTDKLHSTSSIAAAMVQSKNAETLRLIENYLNQTLKGVTVANKGGVEAFLFFFSSLKMAELKILQSVAIHNTKKVGTEALNAANATRAALLASAADFITVTLKSRSCEENIDLNYLAIAQVCFLMSSSHRHNLALRCYCRALMSISCMINRQRFLPGVNGIVSKTGELDLSYTGAPEYSAIVPDEEAVRIVCFTMICCSKITDWCDSPGYNEGMKVNSDSFKRSKMVSITLKDGSKTLLTRIWCFESNSVKIVASAPVVEVRQKKQEATKGFSAQHKVKPRLEAVVDSEEVADPFNDTINASPSKISRNPTNMFQRLSMFFSRTRSNQAAAIINTSRGGASKAVSVAAALKNQVFKKGDAGYTIISSEIAFTVLSVLSRLSRILLLKSAFDIGAFRGERARFLLCGIGEDAINREAGVGIPSELFDQLKTTQMEISDECKSFPVPPGSIRDLSVRPQRDINRIFRSQLKLTKLLTAEEQCLFNKIIKHDSYLPLVTSSATFTRSISSFDDVLFDQETLLEAANDEEENEDDDESSDEEEEREEDDNKEVELEKREEKKDESPDSKKNMYLLKSSKNQAVPQSSSAVVPDNSHQVYISNNTRAPRGKPSTSRDDENKNREEKVVEDIDQLLPHLCNSLDGSLSSIQEVLVEHLKPNDAVFIWHMSSLNLGGNHSLHVIVGWWDKSGPESGSGVSKDNRTDSKRIIIELAKSESDTSRVNFLLQNLLDATNGRTSALRNSMSIDALRSLSECFSLGEILQMLPTTINNIVMCCPPALRLVPWHALDVLLPTSMFGNPESDYESALRESKIDEIIEGGGDSQSTELLDPEAAKEKRILDDVAEAERILADKMIKNESQTPIGFKNMMLIEKYSVHIGPTLSMYELTCNKVRSVKHTAGNHKMCFIDGDGKISALKGSNQEAESVTKTWSVDSWDYLVLSNQDACANALTTKRKKAAQKNTGDNKKNEARSKPRNKNARRGSVISFAKWSEEEPKNEDGEDEDGDDDEENKKKLYNSNALSLLNCRVLHVCAAKVIAPMPTISKSNIANMTAGAEKKGKKRMCSAWSLPLPVDTQDTKSMFTSKDVVSSLYLRNCNLCVLSRFGITDGSVDINSLTPDWEFIDALHFAGASTCMYPLWGGSGTNSGSHICRIIFLLRFYFELPLFCAHSHPVAEACRQAQLWLKDSRMGDITMFLQQAPIDEPNRKSILDEVGFFITASPPPIGGPDAGKIFHNFLLWGAFSVSGAAAEVHPAELMDVMPKRDDKVAEKPKTESIFGGLFGSRGKQKVYLETEYKADQWGSITTVSESELRAEARLLRREGEEALAAAADAELKRRRQAKVEEVKRRLQDIKETAEHRLKTIKDTAISKRLEDSGREQGSEKESSSGRAAEADPNEEKNDDDNGEEGITDLPVSSSSAGPSNEFAQIGKSSVRLAPLTGAAPPSAATATTTSPSEALAAARRNSVYTPKSNLSESAAKLAAQRRSTRKNSEIQQKKNEEKSKPTQNV